MEIVTLHRGLAQYVRYLLDLTDPNLVHLGFKEPNLGGPTSS
jgi:hypothetical protein